MAITRLSDTMIRAMLAALAYQGSDGRYQVLTRGSTRTALESRGMVEVEETRDEHGRPVSHHYLTPKALATLRNGFAIMMGKPDSKATEWHRAAIRSNTRISRAAAALILGDIAGAKVITRTPGRAPTTEDMTAEQAIVTLSLLLTKGQRIEEYGTGPQGDEPPTRLVAHTGDGFPREYEFILTHWGPGQEAEEAAPASRSMAGIPNVCKAAEDIAAEYTAEAAELLGDGERFMRHWRAEEDSASVPVDRAEALALVVKALREDWTTGRHDGGLGLVTPGTATYLLVPIPEEPPAAPEPRPAAEVLAADPIPADTSVRDGMPGEEIAREGLRTPRDVMAAEAYVVQVRSERVWQLPNHDDGAHMSRGDVAWSLRRMMDRNPEQTRASVDTDGTVYLSNGWQAYRYVPVNLFADYSADRCPGCGTPYAVNGDGPCEGGRSPLAPGSRDYDAEAAALLGDGERWVRHWFNKGELSAVNGMDRREALATVALGLKRGEVRPADEGGVRVEHDGGSSAYWLEPVTVQPNPAAAEERPSVDPDEIRAQVVAEAEGKPCRGCGAPAGESCEPMSECEEAREEVVAARVDEAANLGAAFFPQEADDADGDTHPCLVLGTGEVVTVYREGGRLVVSVDLSGLPADGDPLPMVITVGEREVFVADEEYDTARDVRQVVEEFKEREREDYEEQERQGEDVDGHPFEALERLGELRF